ncbi:MAG: type II secretion system protein [Desulfamplus sp.]|nr:type II secretion system protein [Desulfamplus sp.]
MNATTIRSGKSGFTLLELIVVLAVIGTVLFITMPKFRTLTFGNNSNRQLNLLLNTVRDLKKRSISDDMDYILHLDSDRSVMWITSSDMPPEIMDKTREKGTPLPESLYLAGVDIYGTPDHRRQDEYRIIFSRYGYCDMALIHIRDRESMDELTVIIEPFLSDTKIIRKHISFEQCI